MSIMKTEKRSATTTSGLAAMIVATIGLVACAATPETESDVPVTSMDSIDQRDEGTSYNGWTASANPADFGGIAPLVIAGESSPPPEGEGL